MPECPYEWHGICTDRDCTRGSDHWDPEAGVHWVHDCRARPKECLQDVAYRLGTHPRSLTYRICCCSLDHDAVAEMVSCRAVSR
jgi:hypothetical protein